jgi:inner membrane protein
MSKQDDGRATSRLITTTPVGLLAVVFTCDVLRDRKLTKRAAIGALDEVAHLATAAIVVFAVRELPWLRERKAHVCMVLASTVLIDLDHVRPPSGSASTLRGGRSRAHSMTTVLAALLGSTVAGARRRGHAMAAAIGLAIHLGRDVATGHGLMLWWPLSKHDVKVHYGYYAVACSAAMTSAVARLRSSHARDRDRKAASEVDRGGDVETRLPRLPRRGGAADRCLNQTCTRRDSNP